jgi:hypothetical protein
MIPAAVLSRIDHAQSAHKLFTITVIASAARQSICPQAATWIAASPCSSQ